MLRTIKMPSTILHIFTHPCVFIHTNPTHTLFFFFLLVTSEANWGKFSHLGFAFFFVQLNSVSFLSEAMNMNNGYREGDNSFCYFHPKEVVVGVCALCLTERLLILAARKGHHRNTQSFTHRKTPITLPKIFAFGSFLNRKPDYLDQEASTSQEDSFISIKFEDNGIASWEKNKVSLDHCNMPWNHNFAKDSKEGKETKSVIEHGKSHTPLRWRKRIGHLFQLSKWKRSNKSSACHVSNKVEGVKVRKGWIRSLTKRRGSME